MTNEIYYFKRTLINYLEDDPIKFPILATFTSTYTNTSRGAINMDKTFKKFRHMMHTSLATRRVPFPLVAWALEHSKDSVHIHCIFQDFFSSSKISKLWKYFSNATGHIDIKEFGDFKSLVNYIFKNYQKITKYMGHCVIFRKEHLYIHKLISELV